MDEDQINRIIRLARDFRAPGPPAWAHRITQPELDVLLQADCFDGKPDLDSVNLANLRYDQASPLYHADPIRIALLVLARATL